MEKIRLQILRLGTNLIVSNADRFSLSELTSWPDLRISAFICGNSRAILVLVA